MESCKLAPDQLVRKYDRPIPRYTSYPSVPYWQSTPPTMRDWMQSVNDRFGTSPLISLYIHLPFCEQLCTYCACNKRITKNHSVERPYIEALLAEWSLYLKSFPGRPKIAELHLGGGTPTFFQPENLSYLLAGIFRHADPVSSPKYSFESHPANTTIDHLSALADFGFKRISIGVQDFNQAILRLINRDQSYEQVTQTVETARALGYTSVNFDLIYGLPTQTIQDIELTIERVKNIMPERIAYYSYAHVPWVRPSQRAYAKSDLPEGAQKRMLFEVGKLELNELGYRDIGMDHFVLPQDELLMAADNNALHRNFMGYTPYPTKLSIGLGCSAISDSWDTYVQNEKKVEDYMAAVNNHMLPITRGHQLKAEDQIIRQHILNLMCNLKTSWQAPEMRCDAIGRALETWSEMAAEGLVKRRPYSVQVTPMGRQFLRNICLPLDDHYWATQHEGPTFSKTA